MNGQRPSSPPHTYKPTKPFTQPSTYPTCQTKHPLPPLVRKHLTPDRLRHGPYRPVCIKWLVCGLFRVWHGVGDEAGRGWEVPYMPCHPCPMGIIIIIHPAPRDPTTNHQKRTALSRCCNTPQRRSPRGPVASPAGRCAPWPQAPRAAGGKCAVCFVCVGGYAGVVG